MKNAVKKFFHFLHFYNFTSMRELPEFSEHWKHENDFYWSSPPQRMAKLLSHWELFQKSADVPGDIVECGVFKGASLIRFATFRELSSCSGKRVIGFDIFDKYPETDHEPDKDIRNDFVENAGEQSISVEQLTSVLEHKSINKNIDLVKGDINKSVPNYIDDHPELRISLLHVDVDIYEPTVTIMDFLFPRVVKGGIVIFDDYGDFDGEATAVEDYFEGQYELHAMPCGIRGAYMVK